jgi:thioesterase domain-containing protein
MQDRGIDGAVQPLDSIEAMAQLHTDEIREAQPHGPYFLIGYSLGGLVAFEIARNLMRMGSRVGLLAMVDSYPHPSRLRLEQRFRLLARSAGRSVSRFASTIARRPFLQADSYEKANGSPGLQRVRHCADRALRKYRPSFYPGRVKFIRAETITTFPENPADAWAPFAGEFEVETVPGDHVGMIMEHSRDLALVLSHYIQAALNGQ